LVVAELRVLWVQAPVVLKPESSGIITVTSSSVYEKPVIDPKYGTPPRLAYYTLTFAPAAFLPQITI
jgi:hypothetical protein